MACTGIKGERFDFAVKRISKIVAKLLALTLMEPVAVIDYSLPFNATYYTTCRRGCGRRKGSANLPGEAA